MQNTTKTMAVSALALALSLGLGSAAANEGYKVKEQTERETTKQHHGAMRHDATDERQGAIAARIGSAEADRLLAEFRRLDADNDGSVRVAQLDAGDRTELARFDADDDGKLDRYEFSMARSARFDDLDRDNDGALSRTEVDAIRPEWVSFVALDSDNDQALSEQEYERFIASGDWVQDQDRYAFEYVDLDGDGFVNEAEAEVFVPLSSQFTAVDVDGDGLVDRTQYEVLLTEVELEQQNRVAGQ